MRTPFAALVILVPIPALFAGEAGRFEMPVTISGSYIHSGQSASPPRAGSPVTMGARMVAYPSIRIGSRWSAFAAVQVHTRPYFHEQLSTQGNGIRGDILQAYLAYHLSGGTKALTVRAGQLLSSFGSFLLRYDDMQNPLIDMPLMYGYYYRPVTTLGLPGVQADLSLGRFDGRIQYTRSSPANRRSLFDTEQYGAWTAGAGVTLATGIRAGASAYRGAYLHRQHRFFRTGEADPRDLPGTGYGVDVQVARGRWSIHGEAQRHVRAYKAIPTLFNNAAYGEVRYTVSPRIYLASRTGFQRGTRGFIPSRTVQEFAAGYRLGRGQLLKVSYEVVRGTNLFDNRWNVLAIQWVAHFDGPSL